MAKVLSANVIFDLRVTNLFLIYMLSTKSSMTALFSYCLNSATVIVAIVMVTFC